jgi:adenine/guanine phosphoribosyltransferase-like PRPP-binding protein
MQKDALNAGQTAVIVDDLATRGRPILYCSRLCYNKFYSLLAESKEHTY